MNNKINDDKIGIDYSYISNTPFNNFIFELKNMFNVCKLHRDSTRAPKLNNMFTQICIYKIINFI